MADISPTDVDFEQSNGNNLRILRYGASGRPNIEFGSSYLGYRTKSGDHSFNTDSLSGSSTTRLEITGGSDIGSLNVMNANLDVDGNTIYNYSGGYIEQSILENDTITIAGNSVALGSSIGITHGDLSTSPVNAHINNLTDIPTRNHNDLNNISSGDHHIRPSAGDGLTDASNIFNIDVSNFAGSHLSDDGSENLQVNDDFVSNSGDKVNGSLEMEGNEVDETSRIGVSDASQNDKFDIEYNSGTNSLDFNYVGG